MTGSAASAAARARRADLAFAGSAVAALVLLVLAGALQRRLELIGNDDFSRLWAGPRALLTGHDPYDPATWGTTSVALGTLAPDTSVYIYPPWVALLLLPFGLLPLPAASLAWLALSLAAGLAGLRALVRTWLPGRPGAHAAAAALLLLSWVGALSLVIGQWGALLIAALGACLVALRAGRPGWAGLAAVSLIIKPQLFILAAPAIALQVLWPIRGRVSSAGVRFLAAALGGTAAAVALSWLVVPSWWPSWFTHISRQQLGPDSDTIPGLLFTLGGAQALRVAPLLQLALVGLGLAFHPRSAGWLPLWLALSLADAPYANSYDQMLLVVPVVLASGAAARRSRAASRWVLGLGALVLIGGTPLLYEVAVRRHSETFGVVVPLAVALIVAVAHWPLRRVPDPPPGRPPAQAEAAAA